jgi:hypothetical protein
MAKWLMAKRKAVKFFFFWARFTAIWSELPRFSAMRNGRGRKTNRHQKAQPGLDALVVES